MRLSFAILRSASLCLRGSRVKRRCGMGFEHRAGLPAHWQKVLCYHLFHVSMTFGLGLFVYRWYTASSLDYTVSWPHPQLTYQWLPTHACGGDILQQGQPPSLEHCVQPAWTWWQRHKTPSPPSSSLAASTIPSSCLSARVAAETGLSPPLWIMSKYSSCKRWCQTVTFWGCG